jgi:hypothetical protein
MYLYEFLTADGPRCTFAFRVTNRVLSEVRAYTMPQPPADLAKLIHDNFHKGVRDATIIIFIPQKDKKGKDLQDQEMWAHAAHKLFGELFGGATGFPGLSGSWYDQEQDKVLYETPIMIQSLTKREKMTEDNIRKLLEFAQRMGRETNQACIGIVVSEIFYEMYEFGGK